MLKKLYIEPTTKCNLNCKMCFRHAWKEYKTFRRKFDDFEFSSCIYCGHCELFSENKEDCIGNSHPACGGCLWAEGMLSCP